MVYSSVSCRTLVPRSSKVSLDWMFIKLFNQSLYILLSIKQPELTNRHTYKCLRVPSIRKTVAAFSQIRTSLVCETAGPLCSNIQQYRQYSVEDVQHKLRLLQHRGIPTTTYSFQGNPLRRRLALRRQFAARNSCRYTRPLSEIALLTTALHWQCMVCTRKPPCVIIPESNTCCVGTRVPAPSLGRSPPNGQPVSWPVKSTGHSPCNLEHETASLTMQRKACQQLVTPELTPSQG